MENQTAIGRDFVSSFVTQSDLSRLLSDCNLVPHCLRHQKSGEGVNGPGTRMMTNGVLNSRMYAVENVVDK